jgi:hypothetical protein
MATQLSHHLPAGGTLSYNGVTFSSLFRTSLRGVPELDEARRVTKWVKWALEVDGYVVAASGESSTDDDVQELERLLTQPGGELRYTGRGLSDLVVNVGRVKDANWGPIPTLLGLDPLGGGRGAAVSWRVETCVPMCDSARYAGVAALNYEVGIEIDHDAYTTRTISGHLEIAQTRPQGGGRRLAETADNYRHLVRPEPLEGFRRKQSFKLSKNKNRLDFTITDEQIPVPFVAGASSLDVDYEVSNDRPRIFINWVVRITGSVTLPAGRNKAAAAEVIALVVGSRLAALQGRGQAGRLQAVAGGKRQRAYLLSTSISEQMFGRSTRFSFTYILYRSSLAGILEDSGLWQPVEGTSFAVWKKSLLPTVFHERGAARLTVPASDDALVDLCAGQPSTLRALPLPKGETATLRTPAALGDARIDPEDSWLEYRNGLRLVTIDRAVLHKRLDDDNPEKYQEAGAPDATRALVATLSTARLGAVPEPVDPVADVVQVTASPSYLIEMSGSASRLGHAVPVPQLVSVGGVEVTRLGRDVMEDVAGALDGIKIHRAAWVIQYALPRGMQGRLPDLVNPLYETSGGTRE